MARVAVFRDQSLQDYSLSGPEKEVFSCDYRYRIRIALPSRTPAALDQFSPISFAKSLKASPSRDRQTSNVPAAPERAAELPKNKEDSVQRPCIIADLTTVLPDANSEKHGIHRSKEAARNSAGEKLDERYVKWEGMGEDWMPRESKINRLAELLVSDQSAKQPGDMQVAKRPSRERRDGTDRKPMASVQAKGTPLRRATERRGVEWEEQSEVGNYRREGAEEVDGWGDEEEGRSREGAGVGRGKKCGEVAVFDAEKYFWSAERWSEAEEEEAGGDLPLSGVVEVGRSSRGGWRGGRADDPGGLRRKAESSEVTSPRISTGSTISEMETIAPPLAAKAASKVKSKQYIASPKLAASPSNRLANLLARFKLSSAASSPSSASRKSPTSPILHFAATPSGAALPSPASAPPNKTFYSHARHLPPNGKPPSPRSRVRFLRAFSSSSSAVPVASSASISGPEFSPLRIRTSASAHSSPYVTPAIQSPESHPDRRPHQNQYSFDSRSCVRHDRIGADASLTSPCSTSLNSSRVYRSHYDYATTPYESPLTGGLPAPPASLTAGSSLNDNPQQPERSKSIGAKRNGSSTSTAFRIPFLNRKLKSHLTEKGNSYQSKDEDKHRSIDSRSSNCSSVSTKPDFFNNPGKGDQSLFRHLLEEQERMNGLDGSPFEGFRRRSRMGEVASINEERERRKILSSEEKEDIEIEKLLRVVERQLAATSKNPSSQQLHEPYKRPDERSQSWYANLTKNPTGSEQSSWRMNPTKLEQGKALHGTCSETASTANQAVKEAKEEFYDSDSSSDLFEIESLAAGLGLYRRDLPVYQATDLPSICHEKDLQTDPASIRFRPSVIIPT